MDTASFVAKWSASGAAERANKDAFLIDLCDVLDVDRPAPTTGDRERDLYVFERDALLAHAGGALTVGKIDLYKHGCFILEAKQGSDEKSKKLGTAKRATPAWNIAMRDAYGQALGYAATIERPPPFLVTCDLGYCFDLYAAFDGSHAYRQFPNGQQYRIFFADLDKRPEHVETLRTIFVEPHALDPSRRAAKVTREVAAHLAELAKALEGEGHPPDVVASFLMRCLFTMFAEDVGLLPSRLFTEAIERLWIPNPRGFTSGIETLWKAMNEGTGFGFVGKLLRFNGGLFRTPTALALTADHLKLLLEAARCDWSGVEPAIFGTLLERALDPRERHALGAHYTPRAYVERLVRPTVEEPLRDEWNLVQAEVRQLVEAGKLEPAKKSVRAFLQRLCSTRVLDPACGTGNFLYVTLDLFKRLEGEVLALLADLGETQTLLDVHGVSVTPKQFLGIEVNPWAKQIADLVLWIGYLQWHFRMRGKVMPPEPVLSDYGNIECRDAVLAWDKTELARDADGRPVTRWDGRTYKVSPITGEDIPDESARITVDHYVNPRRAEWPTAEFIVGNPPFLGKLKILEALGAGYVEALRAVYGTEIPDSVDYVMYWWWRAAIEVLSGGARRFGLVTTKGIAHEFNRKVVSSLLDAGLSLAFALPNHPWIDGSAAIRIAMTVGSGTITAFPVHAEWIEQPADNSAEEGISVTEKGVARINPDLTVGIDTTSAKRLRANLALSHVGVGLHGAGFSLDRDQALALRAAASTAGIASPEVHVRPTLNGRDLAQAARGRFFVDLFGLSEVQARMLGPIYQWVLLRVKPERDHNPRELRKRNWWLFGENAPNMRIAVDGLPRFIGTTLSARHRVFQFISPEILPDQTIVVVASDDAALLSVLSSRCHLLWAEATGARLGVGNDLRYLKAGCPNRLVDA